MKRLRLREYVPYKVVSWYFEVFRVKTKTLKENSQYKVCSARNWWCASGFTSVLLSVFFLPALLFLPLLPALPQPPPPLRTQCARVTSFWSAFLKFSVHLDLKNKAGCTWRPQQVRPISLVQRKVLLPDVSFFFFLYSIALSQKCLPHKIRSYEEWCSMPREQGIKGLRNPGIC